MWKRLKICLGSSEEARSCPNCKGSRVRRSRRKNTAEKTLYRLLLLYPYRCEACDERYFTLGELRVKAANGEGSPSASES